VIHSPITGWPRGRCADSKQRTQAQQQTPHGSRGRREAAAWGRLLNGHNISHGPIDAAGRSVVARERASGLGTKAFMISTPDVSFSGGPDAFVRFARTADAVGATTKRLEKARVLGAYFQTLRDEDLNRAARYFGGYVFSLRDQRTTNVGGAALLAAVLAADGETDETRLRERLVALGDIGDVAGEAFAANPRLAARAPVLTLADVAAFLEDLAATSGTKRKIEMVTALLGRATPARSQIPDQTPERRPSYRAEGRRGRGCARPACRRARRGRAAGQHADRRHRRNRPSRSPRPP
jgi:hypothetical protein